MIQIEGVTGWHITQIDQSIAASDIRNDRPRSTRAVRIMAQAYGPRQDAWEEAVRANGDVWIDSIVIHACIWGPDFATAMVALQDEIAHIEATNAY